MRSVCQWETQEDLPVVVALYRIWMMAFSWKRTWGHGNPLLPSWG